MNYKMWIDKMPDCCMDCPCYNEDWFCCNITEKDIDDEYDKPPKGCPLKLISDYGRKEKLWYEIERSLTER